MNATQGIICIQHSVFCMMCSRIKKKLRIPPCNIFLEEINSGRALKFQEPSKMYSSRLKYCIQPSESILTRTHTQATYAHPMTKKYTGLTTRAETGLHLNCRDTDICFSITINDHFIIYATIVTNKHRLLTSYHTNVSHVSWGNSTKNDIQQVSCRVLVTNMSVQYKGLWLFGFWRNRSQCCFAVH